MTRAQDIRAKFWRVEALQTRQYALAAQILDHDNNGKYAGEFWRGLKNSPPALQCRYSRICKAVARYRTAWLPVVSGAEYDL